MKTLIPYTGNRSFAARNAAFSDAEQMQRFFIRENGWADVRIASLDGLQKLLQPGDYRPGGTASSKLQIRWTESVVNALGYEFKPVAQAASGDAFDATAFMLAVASK